MQKMGCGTSKTKTKSSLIEKRKKNEEQNIIPIGKQDSLTSVKQDKVPNAYCTGEMTT